jgi:hypothetical protein
MKKLLFILLFIVPQESIAIGVEVLSNSKINDQYGIRIELAEKSIQECSDFVVYAPLVLKFEDLGERKLGRIDVAEYATVPTIREVTSKTKLTEHKFSLVGNSARALGCIRKESLSKSFFRLYYYSEGASTIMLVAPLISNGT